MWHNARRVSAARSCAHAREQFASVIAECDALQCELVDLRAEFDKLRRELAELHQVVADVVTGLRRKADQDVAQLRHQLEIALVRLTKRDPAQPLQ